ncbi:MAG: transporter substrate-binding domain-containing protein [Anaeromicrobium sp.]|jgi:polar amino acid transport system substrate-binding protein|uniref:transporter substrate-binding domain-containing protein n=1 Tax=Anaeromicrobium sp. TaxID=1929132 RepID=UPI0025D69472|nr:transporter substrate-binding domain-containing protein [Anaeromicrobium sp.]MCT4593765.1 transporter substrate-binding domain-containing protein [Anaeromicrobium sp.]
MKKILSILLGLLLVISMAACKGEEVQSKVDSIKSQGKIVIGTSAAYPPYEFHKDINGKDTIVGFDIDIANEIAKELGVEVEIKDMAFDGLLAALNGEKVDIIIAGMTPTEERKKSVDFSKIYYQAKQAVVILDENSSKINSLDKLKDIKIGVQKGTVQEELAKEYGNDKKIKGLAKLSNIMLDLLEKKVDVVIVESPVAKSYVNKYEELIISDVKIETNDNGSAIAVKKGNEDLVKVIDSVLDKLMKENKIEEFVAKNSQLAEE